MKTKPIDGLTLFFDSRERDAAELIGQACEQSVEIIHACWGLDTPEDCRVYVMTSWLRFLFHAPPWPYRILVAATLPLWYFRARKLWALAGGWHQQFGQRRAVGVKPPHLLQLADTRIGKRIFVQEDDLRAKVQRNTCHELTHAFTSHLGLPMWLNEGLAMVTVDRFAGKPTIKRETLQALAQPPQDTSPGRYRQLRGEDMDNLMFYHCVRGYWLTRYMQDTQPDLLQDLLRQKHSHGGLESKVAAAYGMEPGEFWKSIDAIIVSHFKEGISIGAENDH
ncbi:MAG: hypothetical protein JW918_01635 [Anaerolineae bacterium]|nr:hypothetical protein [Anaerolineae bacterium]